MRSWRRLLSGARRRIQSTRCRAPHHDQDIVFDNRADAVVDYCRIRSREPAFATTLAEGAITSGVQVEVRSTVYRLQGVRGRSRSDAQCLRLVQRMLARLRVITLLLWRDRLSSLIAGVS